MKSSFYASNQPGNQPGRHHQRKALMRLALWGGLMAYMTYHLLHGNRGLLALWKIRRIVQEEREVLTKLEDETETLARQIRLLRPQSLDLDLLDERAREVLNMAEPDEIILEAADVFRSAAAVAQKAP